MAIQGIKKEDLVKKLQDKQKIGMPQVQVNPAQSQGVDANSWAGKYGENSTVFDVASGKVSSRTANAPTVQTMGAQAGSSSNPVTPNDNSGSNFSLADAVRMDNLPAATGNGVNTVQGVKTNTSSALQQANGSGYNDRQGGPTDDGNGRKGSVGYEGSRIGLYASLSYTPRSTTVKVSDITGNGVAPNQPNPNGVGESESNSVNPEKGNVNGSGNKENPNDSSNGKVDNNDPSNPKNQNTQKADLKRTEEKAQKDADNKAKEKEAERQAEQAA